MSSQLKGYKNLTEHQKQFFNETLTKHQDCLGDELKEKYTPVSVKGTNSNNVNVTFKNGEWLHYTSNHEWY